MAFRVNRGIFNRVKAAIIQTKRIDVYWWARVEEGREVRQVHKIRALRLPEDCRTVACVGGWTCAVATEEEIAKAVEMYGLSGQDLNEPFTLAAALLLDDGDGAVERRELEKVCYRLFSLEEWPNIEQAAYCNSRTDTERADVVVRRMETWAAEIESGTDVTIS